MDAYEATRIVFSRVRGLDPENASKIMGLLLIQDHGEKEMIRLAFGPESLVHAVVLKARKELGLSSASPRLFNAGIGSSWPVQPQEELIGNNSPFYGGEMMDEFQLRDQLSFLEDGADPLLFGGSPGWVGSTHRRSCSVSDAPDEAGFGWKPCLYFARGFCKNGASCKFLHGDPASAAADCAGAVGSPGKLDLMEQCHELLRSKSAQQQRLAAAAHLMVSSSSSSASSFPYSPRCLNLLAQQQQHQTDTQRAAAAVMMAEDGPKFGRSRGERNEMVNPASRQIYLTFPADSTFREEDVSNYFSMYGPVEDVRIPYQQKRMFGFVTFVYPETVKIILAKGNPHFVCDARVLVKPYKEKGKVSDKKQQQQQQVERADFSHGLESRDPYDLQLGTRMFYNAQDMLWRRKLAEQSDLQQALEIQGRRLMGLQLLNVKKHQSSLVLPPAQSPNIFSQNSVAQFCSSPEIAEGKGSSSALVVEQKPLHTLNAVTLKEGTDTADGGNAKRSPPIDGSDGHENSLQHNLPDSPFASPTKASTEFSSSFSASAAAETHKPATVSSSSSSINGDLVSSSMLPPSSTLEISSFKSFNCQIPRFSSGHGGIGMSAGTGGPTCPVGI